MRKLILGCILLTSILSCSDEDNQKCKLVRQKYADLTYNYQGLVYSIEPLDANNNPNESGWKRIFEYEGEQLVRINEFQNELLTRFFLFEYSDNQIVQKEFFDSDSYPEYTVTYTLNNKGKILEILHEDDNGEYYTHLYEYKGKNVSKITSVSEVEVSYNYVQEFEYDNKRNPLAITGYETYYMDDIFSYRTQNANNVKKSTIENVGIFGGSVVANYSYSYNSAGYATEVFFSGSSTPIWFYEFECK